MNDDSLPIFTRTSTSTEKRACIALELRGKILFTEELNLRVYEQRQAFGQRLLAKVGGRFPAITAEYVEDSLMRVLDDIRAGQPTITADPHEPLYRISGGCLCERGRDGGEPQPLCDFAATITEEIILDDGQVKTAMYRIRGETAGGHKLEEIEVLAKELGTLAWVEEAWLSQAIIYPGGRGKETIPAAMKYISRPVKRRVVYEHTGWREVAREWVYLHGRGGISAKGAAEAVEVRLAQGLPVMTHYVLPAPPEQQAARNAVQAALRLFDLTADRITFPLFASPWRAALASADFSVFLHGTTGGCKTALGCLATQHFGAGLVRDCGHMNWNSTANQLEVAAYALKDTLCYIDDYKPPEDRADRAQYGKTARRMLNAQADRAGRGRLGADGRTMSSRAPRGTLLTTGEEKVRGDSLQGRIVFVPVHSDNLDPKRDKAAKARLDGCQADAVGGQLASAMAGFLKWIAPQYPAVRAALLEQVDQVRTNVNVADSHPRAAGNVAHLYAGLMWFADYAVSVGALDLAAASRFRGRAWVGLLEAAELQARDRPDTDPTRVFLRLLGAALRSGQGHIAGKDGGEPALNPERWGWRSRFSGGAKEGQGRRFGWIVEVPQKGEVQAHDELWLEPDSAYAMAQHMAVEQGRSFPVEDDTLFSQMRERKMLLTLGPRGSPKDRRRFGGDRTAPVLTLAANALDDGGEEEDPDFDFGANAEDAGEPGDAREGF